MSSKQYNENFICLKYPQMSKSLNPSSSKNILLKQENKDNKSISKFTKKHDKKRSKKDIVKNHGKMETKGENGSLEEFNYDQTKDEDVQGTRGQQDDEKPKHIDETGSSQDSDISVLHFRSYILQISGLDGESYTAIEKILAMDTNSDESVEQSNRENCLNTPSPD